MDGSCDNLEDNLMQKQTAVTSALFCSTSPAAVRPNPLTTAPVPFRKKGARHELHFRCRIIGNLPPAVPQRSFRCGFVPAVSPPPLHFSVRRTAGRSLRGIAGKLMLMQPSPMAEPSRLPSLRFCIIKSFIWINCVKIMMERHGYILSST